VLVRFVTSVVIVASCVVSTDKDVVPFLLYGLLIVFGRILGLVVLTSAVSIVDGEAEASSSMIDVGITGMFT
jgi:hypothetical protein